MVGASLLFGAVITQLATPSIMSLNLVGIIALLIVCFAITVLVLYTVYRQK
jgi:hypothetical protein